MTTEHDVFVSYATEDNDFATNIAFGLRANGMSTWFAPLSLRVGDKLLDSIEAGLQTSRAGILILSPAYLAKGWTSYEMDILVRQHIDKKKMLLPIWHGVSKSDVEKKHIGLSGIVAVTDTTSINDVIAKLVEPLSNNAPSRGVIPIWEDPTYRFFEGLGEVHLQHADGAATTIFEFLLYAKSGDFPFWLGGKSYSKEELLLKVAPTLGPDPERVKKWVDDAGYQALWAMCKQHGIDPGDFY